MIRKKQQQLFFEVDFNWRHGGETTFRCNNVKHEQLFEQVCFKASDETCWHPEHLLLAAFSGNYLQTLRSLSQKRGLPIFRFSSNIIGQVEITLKNSRLADINFYPKIEVEDLTQTSNYKDMVDALQQDCLIANILLVPVIHHTVLNNRSVTHSKN